MKLNLIDANSIIHRCFHALPPLTSPQGEPVQALYGLSSVLLRLFRNNPPQYAAALFDRPEPTFRKEKYAAYKAQRPETPNTLIPQLIEAKNLFNVFGIKTYEAAGWEADDLIATLALAYKNIPDLKTEILTGDLDTLQLIEGPITVRVFKKGISETMIYDTAAVKERFQLEPSQLVDYKTLVGDTSDNLKGLSGIGPKTAVAILQKFGSLEKALAQKNPDKLAEKIIGREEDIKESRELVELKSNPELAQTPLSDLIYAPNLQNIIKYLERMGFNTLIKRLDENPPKPSKPTSAQGSMFGN